MNNVLIGTPDLAFMRRSLPHLYDSATRILEDHDKLIKVAQEKIYAVLGQGYDFILTALDYTPGGLEGFRVLEMLWNHPARKILWTERVTDVKVRARAKALHADILDTDEIGSLAGIVYSNSPLKTGGQVLVYVHRPESIPLVEHRVREALGERSLSAVDVIVDSRLERGLLSGRYGLVIDTSAVGFEPMNAHIVSYRVVQELSRLKVPAVPRVVCVTGTSSFGQDVAARIERFLQLQS